jgi:hypothetical protein
MHDGRERNATATARTRTTATATASVSGSGSGSGKWLHNLAHNYRFGSRPHSRKNIAGWGGLYIKFSVVFGFFQPFSVILPFFFF